MKDDSNKDVFEDLRFFQYKIEVSRRVTAEKRVEELEAAIEQWELLDQERVKRIEELEAAIEKAIEIMGKDR